MFTSFLLHSVELPVGHMERRNKRHTAFLV